MNEVSAIVVDDEKIVREGLREHFEWERYDVDVEGYFEDGESAWDFLQEHEVDIVITDVRMLDMDGIALARQAIEKYPNISILFISGYADVEYLHDALKMDAVDYILKSIDLEEFAGAIERITEKIGKRREEKEKIENMSYLLDMSLPLLKYQIILGNLRENDEDMLQDLKLLNFPLDENTEYCIIVLQLQMESKRKLLRENTQRARILEGLQIEEMLSSMVNEYGDHVVCSDRYVEYIIILDIYEEKDEEMLFDVVKNIQMKIRQQFHLEMKAGISEAFRGYANLHEAYTNACKAVERGYRLEEDIPVGINKYSTTEREALQKIVEHNLRKGISENVESVYEILSYAIQKAEQLQTEEEKDNFLLFLLLLPDRLGMELNLEGGCYCSGIKLVQSFLACKNHEEKTGLLSELYDKFVIGMREAGKRYDNASIRKVEKTIEEKYMEQLSIDFLADMVGLTPAYLSVLFKQKTGKTINEYITQIRLEQAKQLLAQTHLHLYEICYQVGYLSPAYFSRLFRKYTGQTPKEWRDTH